MLPSIYVGKREKNCPTGAESPNKISGSTGVGNTGLTAVNCVSGSYTKAAVHDFPSLEDCVCETGAIKAESDESSWCVDPTSSYALSIDKMCNTSLVENSVRIKFGACTANVVCGGSTDEVVSVERSRLGYAVGVVSDAPVEEFVINSLSPNSFNAAAMLYSGVLISEV